MTTFSLSTTMEFRSVEDAAIVVPARVVSGRVTRTVGLAGDTLVIAVPATEWPLPQGPEGIDFKRPCALEFRRVFSDATPDEVVRLEHYYIRQVDPVMVTADNADALPGAVKTAKMVRIRFVSLPGLYRADGRGALLREDTFNRVLSGGEADESDPSFRSNAALVNLCLDALGFTLEFTPASLDDLPPPGPLDWGNRSALIEVEQLLARCGHDIVLPNSGDAFRIIELPKYTQGIVLDAEIEAALARDFIVATAPALRGDTVVVHSGDTRTTVLTWRGNEAMEWVWFFEEGRAWKNAAQTAPLPVPLNDIKPDDIAALRAGPDPGDKEKALRYSRLFRALRLTGDDAGLRLVQAWEPMTLTAPEPQTGTVTLGSMAAAATGLVSVPVPGGGDFFVRADAAGDGSAHAPLGPVEVHAEAGVFVMPQAFVYAYPPPGEGVNGPYGRAVLNAPAAGSIRVYFAHEAAFSQDDADGFGTLDGAFALNYFVAAWTVTRLGEDLVFTQLEGEDLLAAYADPMTVKFAAPWLKRLVRLFPDDAAPVEMNRDELEAQALSLAKMKASLALAEGGVAVCVGFLNKAPGCCGGACSSVTWDLENITTSFVLNDHETPDGELAQRAFDGNRSFASGVLRYKLPGGAVAKTDVKSQTTPGLAMSPVAIAMGSGAGPSAGAGGGSPETASASRGLEGVLPPPLATGLPGSDGSSQHYGGRFYARITNATDLPGNRWAYQWVQVVPVATGFGAGTAVAVPGGYSNATHGTAYNLAESHNDGSGLEGNGFNINNLPEGWSVMPIPVGAVVFIEFCIATAGGKAVFFRRDNAVDGVCPSSGAGAGGGSLLRPLTDGIVAALDTVLTDAQGNVLLDASGEVLLDAGSAEISLSDLAALTSLLLESSFGPFVTDGAGNLLIGDAGHAASPASEQLIDRILTDSDGQPLTDAAGNLVCSA